MKNENCELSTGNSELRGAKDGLPTATRREALQLMGVGVGMLVGCATDAVPGSSANASSAAGVGAAGTAGMAAVGGKSGSAATAVSGRGATGASGASSAVGLPGAGTAGGGGPAAGEAGSAGPRAGAAGSITGAAGNSTDVAGAANSNAGAGGAAENAAGTAGAASAGASAAEAGSGAQNEPVSCPNENTPPVPEGPYYYDSEMNRSDITDGKAGVAVTYRFTLLDGDCKPVEGAVIDIWQTDKEGVYSAYAQQGTTGELFLRGFQYTDAKGEASFRAIFPGWYNGRLTHLHGKVFIDGEEKVTTNFFYPKDVEEAVYASSLYSARGQNRITVAQDIELRGDQERFAALTMSFIGDVASGYVATFVLKLS